MLVVKVPFVLEKKSVYTCVLRKAVFLKNGHSNYCQFYVMLKAVAIYRYKSDIQFFKY